MHIFLHFRTMLCAEIKPLNKKYRQKPVFLL